MLSPAVLNQRRKECSTLRARVSVSARAENLDWSSRVTYGRYSLCLAVDLEDGRSDESEGRRRDEQAVEARRGRGEDLERTSDDDRIIPVRG